MPDHLRRAGLAGAVLTVVVTVGFVVEGLLPPSSGTESVTIDFGNCLNPPLFVDASGWSVNEPFPPGPARQITAQFDYEGDAGTLTTDEGLEISYSRTDRFIAEGCTINQHDS